MAKFREFNGPVVHVDLAKPADERWDEAGEKIADHVHRAVNKFVDYASNVHWQLTKKWRRSDMNGPNRIYLVLGALGLLLASLRAPAATTQPVQPVFAGAVGHGIHTPAGRGGKVIRVTSLAAEGPGSLAEALVAKGPRIVVFEVGGVIDLDGRTLEVTEPRLSIEGQTAPSPGITIIRGPLRISTDDVLVRHIRVRPGDCGKPKRSGWEPDSLAVHRANRVVFDHCSVSWGVDENMSAGGLDPSPSDITFSHCIIAEGLKNSTHKKGAHSMGTLIYGNNQRVAILWNLYACNDVRNPRFNGGASATVANNLIYNPGGQAIHMNNANPAVSIVGNVLRFGPATSPRLNMISGVSPAFMEDNVAFDAEGKPLPASQIAGKGVQPAPEKKNWPANFKALPSGEVEAHVLARAGARPKDRDEVDRRILSLVTQRKGQIIDSQEQVGGYPKVQPTRRKLDVPSEGVQEWLDKLAAEVE